MGFMGQAPPPSDFGQVTQSLMNRFERQWGLNQLIRVQRIHCPPARTGFPGLRPEIGKKEEKYWFWPSPENRKKKKAEKLENKPKIAQK